MVLLNAAYQDGREREPVARVLRWTVKLAGLLLVPLVLLAAWATMLRVGQYGLTPGRVVGLALLLPAALYAGGYAWAAVSPGPWMQRLEPVNVWAALLVILLIVTLLSPLADPARLSTADQLARLNGGRIAPEHFDFSFFRFRAARFGREALDRLAASPQAAVAERARRARALTNAWNSATEPEGQEPAFSHAKVLPTGTVLPDSFRRQDWSNQVDFPRADCMTGGAPCNLFVRDIDGDGKPEVLVSTREVLMAFTQGKDGRWTRYGNFDHAACAGVFEALQTGRVQASPRQFESLVVDGQWLPFRPDETGQCRKPAPALGPSKTNPPVELGPAFTRP